MYLEIKLIEYNIIIYTKILSNTNTRWSIRAQPKLNLINKRTMGTFSKQGQDFIRFNKIKDYSKFGYTLLKVIDDLELPKISDSYIYE